MPDIKWKNLTKAQKTLVVIVGIFAIGLIGSTLEDVGFIKRSASISEAEVLAKRMASELVVSPDSLKWVSFNMQYFKKTTTPTPAPKSDEQASFTGEISSENRFGARLRAYIMGDVYFDRDNNKYYIKIALFQNDSDLTNPKWHKNW